MPIFLDTQGKIPYASSQKKGILNTHGLFPSQTMAIFATNLSSISLPKYLYLYYPKNIIIFFENSLLIKDFYKNDKRLAISCRVVLAIYTAMTISVYQIIALDFNLIEDRVV